MPEQPIEVSPEEVAVMIATFQSLYPEGWNALGAAINALKLDFPRCPPMKPEQQPAWETANHAHFILDYVQEKISALAAKGHVLTQLQNEGAKDAENDEHSGRAGRRELDRC